MSLFRLEIVLFRYPGVEAPAFVDSELCTGHAILKEDYISPQRPPQKKPSDGNNKGETSS